MKQLYSNTRSMIRSKLAVAKISELKTIIPIFSRNECRKSRPL